jgi:sugar-specific transcriptional regulator TrmB
MNQLSQQLESLGLSEYESKIYAVLLEHSPASASFIAKRCALSRSSVYTTLHSLTGKGLVGTTYTNEIKQFVAQDVSAIETRLKKEKEILDERFKSLDSLRENVRLLASAQLHVPHIVFFEGQEGLKKAYLSMMREAERGTTLRLLRDEFVWEPDWNFIFQQDWHERVKRFKIEKQIHTKLVEKRKMQQTKVLVLNLKD